MALSKINPTKLSSWKKLVQQFDKENNLHINDFFKVNFFYQPIKIIIFMILTRY